MAGLPVRVKTCRPKSRDSCLQAAMPRTLFPFSSSGGEKKPIPKRPGTTAMMPPPTPLFAGIPTS